MWVVQLSCSHPLLWEALLVAEGVCENFDDLF